MKSLENYPITDFTENEYKLFIDQAKTLAMQADLGEKPIDGVIRFFKKELEVCNKIPEFIEFVQLFYTDKNIHEVLGLSKINVQLDFNGLPEHVIRMGRLVRYHNFIFDKLEYLIKLAQTKTLHNTIKDHEKNSIHGMKSLENIDYKIFDYLEYQQSINDFLYLLYQNKVSADDFIGHCEKEKKLCNLYINALEINRNTAERVLQDDEWLVKMANLDNKTVPQKVEELDKEQDLCITKHVDFQKYKCLLEGKIQEVEQRPEQQTAPSSEQKIIDEHLEKMKKKSLIDNNNKMLVEDIFIQHAIFKLINNIDLGTPLEEVKAKIKELKQNKQLKKISQPLLQEYKILSTQNKPFCRYKDIRGVLQYYDNT